MGTSKKRKVAASHQGSTRFSIRRTAMITSLIRSGVLKKLEKVRVKRRLKVKTIRRLVVKVEGEGVEVLVELLSTRRHRNGHQGRGGIIRVIRMLLKKSMIMMVVIKEMSWTMMVDMTIENSRGNVEAVVVNVIKDETSMKHHFKVMMVDMSVANHGNLLRTQI